MKRWLPLLLVLPFWAGCEIKPRPLTPKTTEAVSPPLPEVTPPPSGRKPSAPSPEIPPAPEAPEQPPARETPPPAEVLSPAILTGPPPTSLPVRRPAMEPSQLQAGARVITPAERQQEVAGKLQRVRQFLAAQHLAGMLIKSPPNFAWLTGGGIEGDRTEPFGGVLVLAEGKQYLFAPNSKIRKVQTELADLPFLPKTFRWDRAYTQRAEEQLVRALLGDRVVGADVHYPGTEYVGEAFAPLRVALGEGEQKKYRWLGAATAQAVERVCRSLGAGATQTKVRAALAAALRERGVIPVELAITSLAAEPRSLQIRVRAQRWGLVVSLTRQVSWGTPPSEQQEAYQTAAQAYAALLSATKPQALLGEIFATAQQVYAAAGHPRALLERPVGGLTAYRSLEMPACPGSSRLLLSGSAVVWEPTLGTAGLGDTFLVLADHLEMLTFSPSWPRGKISHAGRTYTVPEVWVLTPGEEE